MQWLDPGYDRWPRVFPNWSSFTTQTQVAWQRLPTLSWRCSEAAWRHHIMSSCCRLVLLWVTCYGPARSPVITRTPRPTHICPLVTVVMPRSRALSSLMFIVTSFYVVFQPSVFNLIYMQFTLCIKVIFYYTYCRGHSLLSTINVCCRYMYHSLRPCNNDCICYNERKWRHPLICARVICDKNTHNCPCSSFELLYMCTKSEWPVFILVHPEFWSVSCEARKGYSFLILFLFWYIHTQHALVK